MPATELAILDQILLSNLGDLSLDSVRISAERIDLDVSNRAETVCCTNCGSLATRVHSFYVRTLAYLSCCEHTIFIHFLVRRFFCDGPSCSRITFAEQIPELSQKYARKTRRLSEKLYRLGLEVGGETGKRVSKIFDIPTSGDSLIRYYSEQPSPATPRVLGIDDWAWPKRHTYGTILVDLERRAVVDLLPDRKPETISQWLRNHPGIEIISRDRGKEYIEGIALALPEVEQVADRFHLLRNLLEALQRMLERYPGEIKTVSKQVHLASLEIVDSSSEPCMVEEPIRTFQQIRFEEVKQFQSERLSQREISRRTGLSRRTISKYFQLDVPPSKKGKLGRISNSTTFYAHLVKRIESGCCNVVTLHQELEQMGFQGSYSSVLRAVHRLSIGNLKQSSLKYPSPPRFSPKQAAWVLFQREDQLKEPYISLRNALCADFPLANKAKDLVQDFRKIVRDHDVDSFERWLIRLENCSIPEFVRLAASFRTDYAAVRASVISPWSNGQVEGQINRLKLIKRQMFGRAGFDLLRRRVLGPGPFS
jgi:transposase